MRPDAASIDFRGSTVSQAEPSPGCENCKNDSRANSVRCNTSYQEAGFAESYDDSDVSQYGKGAKIMASPGDVIASSHDRKDNTNFSRGSGVSYTGLKTPNKGKNNVMAKRVDCNGQIKFSLARTRSSPELHNEDRSRENLKRLMQTGNIINVVGKRENKNSHVSQISERHNNQSSEEVPSSSTHKGALVNEHSSISPSRYHNDLELVVGHGAAAENHSVKPKDIPKVPMVFPGFNGAVPVPQPHFLLNSSAAHLPVPMASLLASAGYIPRNLPGSFSGNPLIEHPWGVNVHIAQGMLPPQMAHYFPNTGHISNLEDLPNRFNEQLSFPETNSDAENDNWIDNDNDVSSSGGFDMENRSVDVQAIEDQLQSNSSRIGSSHSASGSGNLTRNNNFPRENNGSMTTESVDSFQYTNYTENEFSLDRQIPSLKNQPISRHSSLRSRTSSESSWDGLSAKTSKIAKEKRAKKIIPPDIQYAACREENAVEGNTNLADNDAYRDSGTSSTIITNYLDRNTRLPLVALSDISRHHCPGSEPTLVNGSDVIPCSPMVLGLSQQKPLIDSGAPFTFFPTGPPVPFFTRLPLYNFPSKEELLNKAESDKSVELSDMHDTSIDSSMPELARKVPTPTSTADQQSDILSGNFPHHLTNLYYGRLCQVPNQGPLIHPPAAVVPPMYLQNPVPWVGPGRPSANLNQIYMSYGPRIGPLAPFQTMPYRPVNPYQQIADEMPRYRSGTGTYLPNHVSCSLFYYVDFAELSHVIFIPKTNALTAETLNVRACMIVFVITSYCINAVSE